MGDVYTAADPIRLLETEGIVVLPGPAPASDSARVAYNFLPLDLPAEWRLRRLEAAPMGESLRVEEDLPTPADSDGGTQLAISGSKTFSVEMGSRQDLSLEQTLDLTVTGHVTSNVKVQAILTDRETPLQPEGTTRELDDLDQVFLRVEAPNGSLDLGDLVVEETGLRLASFQRVVEGATGRGRLGKVEGWGVGAVTRGQFRQIQFFGTEGRQGPYDLLGGDDEAIIVAGSEKVWFDGSLLQRGETEDYVIDYAKGELVFTSRRAVTEQSEIAVDFEISLEAYRRSLYGASLAASRPDGRRVEILYLAERDDRGEPLGLVLSPSERDLLREVGDGSRPELDSGVQYVGPLMGDYEKVEADSLPHPIFRYMGPDGGSYDVSFIEVGQGSGDYEARVEEGGTVFDYVGADKGRFKPGRPVPRPRSLEVGDVAIGWSEGDLEARAEGAFSRLDRNTLSPSGDGDNVDGAYDVSAGWKTPELTVSGESLGHVRLRAYARQIGSRFESPGRLRDGFYEQEWNAVEGTLTGRERQAGGGLDVVSGSRLQIGGDLERLSSWSGFSADKWSARAQYGGPVRLSAGLSRVRSTDEEDRPGTRATESLGVSGTRGGGSLQIDYRRERSERGEGQGRTGTEFRDIDVAARRGRSGEGLSIRTRVNWRRRWSLAGTDTARETDGLTTELEGGWSGSRSVQTNLLLTRRDLRSYGQAPDRTTHLGRLSVSQSHWNGAWTSQWRAEATAQAADVREQIIAFVGEGLGHYDALGRYVGVGDHEVFFRETGGDEIHSVVDVSGRWTLTPERATARSSAGPAALGVRAWREAQWTSYVRAGAESPGDLGELLRRPSSWWRAGGRAVRGQGEIRTDLRLLTRSQIFSPTLRWESRSAVVRTASASEDLRRTRDFEIHGISSPAERLRLEGRQSWFRESLFRRVESETVLEDEETLRRTRTELTAVLRVSRILRLRSQGARSREGLEGERTRDLWELTPGLVVNLPGGRAEIRARRIWESGDASTTRLFDLERPGWTTRATADVRIQSSVDLNLWIEDRRPDAGTANLSSRVSLRAFF
jgi:hypothetical protein